MPSVRIALWQCAPTARDVEANLSRLDAAAAAAAAPAEPPDEWQE